MAKSLRSKVKRTYRGLKRKVIERKEDERLDKLARKQHAIAGFAQDVDAELPSNAQAAVYKHGGFVPRTNYVPNHARPALNRVHGPRAGVDDAHLEEMAVAALEQASMATRKEKRVKDVAMAVGDDGDEDVLMEVEGVWKSSKKGTKKEYRKKREKLVGVHPSVIRKSSRHPKNKARRIKW
ncbi:hypothetical protein FVE85_5950 [Porphyridium purpureum]|uniref:DUF2423 domain-containing protein n=1 Tax=Porphyridium purpureum TaxID=35688 RepID=A0A5J4Z4W8_PORPP|nr:hypothetical protein FVE85_5950 [Porphyridium purpureum]|eukprot:POR3816..scf295_1